MVAHLLLGILDVALTHHVRMPTETVSASVLRVWVSIACRSHLNVLLVVELIVIQILIFILTHTLNYLGLKRMVHRLDHLLG